MKKLTFDAQTFDSDAIKNLNEIYDAAGEILDECDSVTGPQWRRFGAMRTEQDVQGRAAWLDGFLSALGVADYKTSGPESIAFGVADVVMGYSGYLKRMSENDPLAAKVRMDACRTAIQRFEKLSNGESWHLP